jgi:hypothetical protein
MSRQQTERMKAATIAHEDPRTYGREKCHAGLTSQLVVKDTV